MKSTNLSRPSATETRPARGGWCLFGGSFDPVHLGHLALAAAAREQAEVSKVIYLPAWRSPHKLAGAGPAPAVHRCAMLELAVAGRPHEEVSTWEIERERLSYSWETAEHFTTLLREQGPPGARLSWLLGADQWEKLDTWAHPSRLAKLLVFLVFPRDGYAIYPRPGFIHQELQAHHPTSSTAVRAAVKSGAPLEGLVPPAVATYIRQHGLYQV